MDKTGGEKWLIQLFSFCAENAAERFLYPGELLVHFSKSAPAELNVFCPSEERTTSKTFSLKEKQKPTLSTLHCRYINKYM